MRKFDAMPMKNFLFLCLIAVFMTTACSGNKEKTDEDSSKTVDLGEADEQAADENDAQNDQKADADKGDVAASKGAKARDPKKDSMRKPPRNRPKNADKGKADEALSDAEIAKKNEEASKNADGTPKRGKPAAELEAEAAENKKLEENQVNNAPNSPEKDVAKVPPKEPKAAPAKPKDKLDIEAFINIREFREQTGFAGVLREDTLVGQNDDARYTSMRLATDDSAQLGFALQIWKPGNESAASKRFNDLYNQSFGGQKIKALATDAFSASHHQIHEICFYDKTRRSTVLLSCTDAICQIEQLKSIAQIIQRRLK